VTDLFSGNAVDAMKNKGDKKMRLVRTIFGLHIIKHMVS
jgi:hypothetical protein